MRKQVSVFVVRGIQYYSAPDAYERGALRDGATVIMEREPQNPHDANAVVFRLKGSGHKLGHMSRGPASRWTRTLAAGWPYTARVHGISGGGNSGSLKVEIRIEADAAEHEVREAVEIVLPRRVSGVYFLKCKTLNCVYVGSSRDMRERARGHMSDLVANSHHNRALQADFNRYGQSAFCFVEHASFLQPAMLAQAEAEAIRKMHLQGVSLYNRTSDGQGNLAAKDAPLHDESPSTPDWQVAKPISAKQPHEPKVPAVAETATEWNENLIVAAVCVVFALLFLLFAS